MMPNLVECLHILSVRVLACLSSHDLEAFLAVVALHHLMEPLLSDTALWHHLYLESFGEPIQLNAPHSLSCAFLHMSFHREWFTNCVAIVQTSVESLPSNMAEEVALAFPTTPSLLHPPPTSAAGAVHSMGGHALYQELIYRRSTHSSFSPGAVVRTGGGVSPFAHLLHCIGPMRHDPENLKQTILAEVYVEACAQAISLGVRHIAIIPIGTGLAGCPLRLAAETAMDALWRMSWLFCHCPERDNSLERGVTRFPLEQVSLLCRDIDVYEAFTTAKQNYAGAALSSTEDDCMEVFHESPDSERSSNQAV
ncbi:hypothetical protein AeRB84_001555 [Aphanomyces euteiches]|nr:hypothetical protein AeRB84_001555 [Aphanomyces euteiches]